MKVSYLRFVTILTLKTLTAITYAENSEVTAAFKDHLVVGRSYLAKQSINAVNRREVVTTFLEKKHELSQAIHECLSIRNETNSRQDSIRAQEIAWQALEAWGTGYLLAGNQDLLEATRQAYPESIGGPIDDRHLPIEETTIFTGTSQKELTYARLYFLQVINKTLEFISSDVSGKLRATGKIYPKLPHYVTFDEQERPDALPFPEFNDPNFGSIASNDREAIQSAATLYGNALERLGLASNAYADQIWRGAFSGPSAGIKRSPTTKSQMLEASTQILKNNSHAQFLASLPLAAQLDDGSSGSLNTYQDAKLDKTRVSSTTGQRLRNRILAGERPTQIAETTAWDTKSINAQIGTVRDTYELAALKWAGGTNSVKEATDETKSAEILISQREETLRLQFETQLIDLTGVDPGEYGRLATPPDREAYRDKVQLAYDRFIESNGQSPLPKAPSLMKTHALHLLKAIQHGNSALDNIRSFPTRIEIELDKRDEINSEIKWRGRALGVLKAANILAEGVMSTQTSTGMELTWNVGSGLAAINAPLLEAINSEFQVTVNNATSAAVIKNLLVEQGLAIGAFPEIATNATIASSDLLRLKSKADRLVDDHAFIQRSRKSHWYRDPNLIFNKENAEEEYAELMQEYRIELYKLAKMLEASWLERFSNPTVQGGGSAFALDNGAFDEFTEAESVFAVSNHIEGRQFFNALKKWDSLLREPLYRGAHDPDSKDANRFSGQPISLRRDVFGFIDYKYDEESNSYTTDSTLSRESIQRFRAVLHDMASRDTKNSDEFTRLRIEFPLIYGQERIIQGHRGPVPIVRQDFTDGELDDFWNHRISKIGIKIVGRNVLPRGTVHGVKFDLYGNVSRKGFHEDSILPNSRTQSSFQVPLYQRDPDEEEATFFGIKIDASIGANPVSMKDIDNWIPLFCDNVVVRMDSNEGDLRIENIEDIELYIEMETGPPPPVIGW